MKGINASPNIISPFPMYTNYAFFFRPPKTITHFVFSPFSYCSTIISFVVFALLLSRWGNEIKETQRTERKRRRIRRRGTITIIMSFACKYYLVSFASVYLYHFVCFEFSFLKLSSRLGNPQAVTMISDTETGTFAGND